MNPLNWRHYAGIGFYMTKLVFSTVKAARDGKLDEEEWKEIGGAFRGAVEELIKHVVVLSREEEAKRLNP